MACWYGYTLAIIGRWSSVAKQVKIASVKGNYAVTVDGQNLRIIGNIKPYQYAYTDGKVVYGYSLPSYIPPFIPKKKAKMPLIPIFCASGSYPSTSYNAVYVAYQENNALKYVTWDAQTQSKVLSDWEYNGPAWFNFKNRAFKHIVHTDYDSIADEYYHWHEYIDDQNQQYLQYDWKRYLLDVVEDTSNNTNHYYMQTGDYTLSHLTLATDFTYWDRYGQVYDFHTDTIANYITWPWYSIDNNTNYLKGTKRNIALKKDSTTEESDNSSLSLVLDSIFDEILQEAQTRQGSVAVPANQPNAEMINIGVYSKPDCTFVEPYDDFSYGSNLSAYEDYRNPRIRYNGTENNSDKLLVWVHALVIAYPEVQSKGGWWPVFYGYTGCYEIENGIHTEKELKIESWEWVYNSTMPHTDILTHGSYELNFGKYSWHSDTKKIYKGFSSISNRTFEDVKGVLENEGIVYVLAKDSTGYALYSVKRNGSVTSVHVNDLVNNTRLALIDNMSRFIDAYWNS